MRAHGVHEAGCHGRQTRPQGTNLFQNIRQKFLTPKPRFYGHNQYQIHVCNHIIDGPDRRPRLKGNTGGRSPVANRLNQRPPTVAFNDCFGMKRDVFHLQFQELLDAVFGVTDHQMDIERNLGF